MAVASREPSGEKATTGPQIGGVEKDRTSRPVATAYSRTCPRARPQVTARVLPSGEKARPQTIVPGRDPPRLLARLAVEQHDQGARRIGIDAGAAMARGLAIHPPGLRLIIRVVALHGDGQGPLVGRGRDDCGAGELPDLAARAEVRDPQAPLATDHAQPRAARECDARSESIGLDQLERGLFEELHRLPRPELAARGPPRAGGRRSRR